MIGNAITELQSDRSSEIENERELYTFGQQLKKKVNSEENKKNVEIVLEMQASIICPSFTNHDL